MSSSEFATIFQRALDFVAERLKDAPGIEVAIGDLRKVAVAPPSASLSVELYEPVLVSQKLNVPFDTIERLAEQLLRLGVFHLWVRVMCPDAKDSFDRVMFQTDNSNVFNEKLEESCPRCGRIHSAPEWECIEPVFGLNRDQSELDVFEESDFLSERPLMAVK